jgi:hypothetical protein
MTKSIAKLLDEIVADDLGLMPAQIAMILKHAVRYGKKLEGFVFAFIKDDLVHYDTVDVWNTVNGMRVKVEKFQSHPVVEERLAKRQYRRWYVRGDGKLIPVQTAKVEDLKELFQFITDSDPTYHTSIVSTEEYPVLRKKSIYASARAHPEWGVQYKYKLEAEAV